MAELFVDVCVGGLPLPGGLTYRVPRGLATVVAVGKRVVVPLKNRKVTGYITTIKKETTVEGLRDIIDVLDDAPLFDAKRLSFYRWLSSYYFTSLGEALSLISPPSAEPKSFRHVVLTEEGRRYLREGGDEAIKEVLGKAGTGGRTLAWLLKNINKKAPRSLVERLKGKGLLKEEVRIRAKGERKERFVRLKKECAELLPRARMQKRVVDYLEGKDGWIGLTELKKECGNVADAVRALANKEVVELKEVATTRDPLDDTDPRSYDVTPTMEQKKAIEEIKEGLRKGFAPYLVWGVTGSGKTLVYLKAIEEAVRRGRRALFLVPEIALTMRPAAYLLHRFPGRVAIMHSNLSERERFDTWQRIVRAEVDVVVGTRSALFVPLRELGIIIVDEEHDPSYKQEEEPRYNARDCALMLGKTLGAVVVLGSATPSVETFYNVRRGRIRPLRLEKRVRGARLPSIELVDMGKEEGRLLSRRLVELMKGCLSRGEQAMLFLNRRGFSNFLLCRHCGHVPRCPNCSVSLTLHRAERLLKCHYCEFSKETPGLCPQCGGYDIKLPGVGTERLEEEVKSLFPGVEPVRIDRDTAGRRGVLRELMGRVESRKAQILLGTQMVSKGHHFPHITLVGIVAGDVSLNIPDFRSAERTFQLILQAAGRAGRGSLPARVVVQTFMPEHPCLRHIERHDWQGFLEEELLSRKEAHYPPFRRLALLRVEGTSEKKVVEGADLLKGACQRAARGLKGVEVLGPSEPIPARLRGKARRQALIKAQDAKTLNRFVAMVRGELGEAKPPGVSLVVDVDPVFTG